MEVPTDYSAILEIESPFAAFDDFANYRGIVLDHHISSEDLLITGRAGTTVSTEAHLSHTATPLTTTAPVWTSINKFSGAVSPTGFLILSPMVGLTSHHADQSHMALAREESTGDIGLYTWASLAGTSEALENTIVSGSSSGSGLSAEGILVNDSFIAFSFFDFDTQEYVVVGKDPSSSSVLFEDRSFHGLTGTTTTAAVLNSARKNISGVADQCHFAGTLVGTSTKKFLNVNKTGIIAETSFSFVSLGGGDLSGSQYVSLADDSVQKASGSSTDYTVQTPLSGSLPGGDVEPIAADRSANTGAGEAIQVMLSDGSVSTFHPA